MSHTGFGQSCSSVFQVAYVVDDLDAAIRTWVDLQGTGPWFKLPTFAGIEAVYRGGPSEAAITLAMAFSGNMCIELVQPEDDHPSIWREHIQRHGYGFHHFGRLTPNYDADVKRYVDGGHELAYQTGAPTGGRLGFVDTTSVLSGYQELVELNEPTDAVFTQFYAASLTWDGSDPVRSLG